MSRGGLRSNGELPDWSVKARLACATVAIATFIVTISVTTVPGPRAADPGPPLRIGHYSTRNGMAGFVLDRLGETVKLRFDGSEEIIALSKQPASLGALSLRDDNGHVVLRINNNGGITLFGPGFFDGAGVVRDQDASPLEIPAATKSQAAEKAASLGQQLGRVGARALVLTLEAP